ncbi:b-box zinc finger family protein [Stylonychia lemnae]|uniref:B-box zinc finger family protein n=1 Tax=Stylonychia lemnae TaxID=5949 RepID=A0A078A2M1_STYLE|nr:b-box zinc finger family protein [Stylonychia lemnae]|eukprot:CDW76335.1 b-box zinc finger family protein [Stylonychia lemnae]
MKFERRNPDPPEAIKKYTQRDLYNQYREDNGIRDSIDPDTDLGRQIIYKLRLGLSLYQNPIIHSIYQITPAKKQTQQIDSQLQFRRELLLDSWVTKDEIENTSDILGKGKGFNFGKPQCFTIGKRLDLSEQLQNLEFPKSLTLYLYQLDVGQAFCYPDKVTKEESRQIQLPNNYDSVFIHLKDSPFDIHQSQNQYSRNYLIYKEEQITPLFKVSFKVLNKVAIPFQMARNEIKTCEECKEPATLFCKNEDQFFCNQCDYTWHNINSQSPKQNDDQNFEDHIRYDLIELESLADNFQKDYGHCESHNKRVYEFYCGYCKEAMCALCIVDQQEKHQPKYEHPIMELSTAYDQALRSLKRRNDEVEMKQYLIREQMQQVIEQMKRLKSNSDDVEERLYALLTETLQLLKIKFEEKSNILKNDFSELQRQESEMKFLEDFMVKQAHECDPIQFLQIWDAYQYNMKQIARQKIELTEVPIDLKLEGRPIIISTSGGITKEQFQEYKTQQSNDLKSSLLSKVKLSITKHLTQSPQIDIKRDFNDSKINFNERSMISQRKQQSYNENTQQLLSKKEKRKVLRDKIDHLHSKLSDQFLQQRSQKGDSITISEKNADNSIIQKSIFGVFHKFYPQMINQDLDSRFLSRVFRGSNILSDINKSLLYFNLPYDPILKDRHQPQQLFPPLNSDEKLPQIYQVIDFFERKKAHLMPNIILMQVEIRGQRNIVGGYSSHGWTRDSQVTNFVNGLDLSMHLGGDETSFMFNLTHNLRFEATKVKDTIYTQAAQTYLANDDTFEEENTNSDDIEYDDDGEQILQKIQMKNKKRSKKRNKNNLNSYIMKFGETDLLIAVSLNQ